jgi:peptide/nickel transport system permease protein
VLVQLLTRTLVFAVSLVLASIVVFAFMSILPGDPARVALGVQASQEAVEATRTEFGLDRPLPVQYAEWAGGLLRGDFGQSYVTRALIGPQVLDRLQVTAWLVMAGMLIALIIALLGFVSSIAFAKFIMRGEVIE